MSEEEETELRQRGGGEEEEEEGELTTRPKKRRARRRIVVVNEPAAVPPPPAGYQYGPAGQLVAVVPAKSEPCVSACTCCLLILVLLLLFACAVAVGALWLSLNWPEEVRPGNPFPPEPAREPAEATTATVRADEAAEHTSARTRVVERLNVPVKAGDRYVIRKGDLVPTRNLTSLELYDMAVAGVPVTKVFGAIDAFRATLPSDRRPLCLAHPQLKLSLFRTDANVVYRETGLNLVSVYLGNTTVHMINPRVVGQRNKRYLRSDVTSMRRPDRKRHLSYPETGWFEFVDADVESSESACYDGNEDCERVTSTLRLRGYVAFCVFLAQQEASGADPFFR